MPRKEGPDAKEAFFFQKRLPTSPSHWILPTSHWPEMDLTATPGYKSVWEEGRVVCVKLGTWPL